METQLVLLNACELVGFALALPVGQTREVEVQYELLNVGRCADYA